MNEDLGPMLVSKDLFTEEEMIRLQNEKVFRAFFDNSYRYDGFAFRDWAVFFKSLEQKKKFNNMFLVIQRLKLK